MSRGAVETLFTLAYGRRPAVVASAPGRVNLIGEHLDYNGGAVLPIAIGQRTWVAMAQARDDESKAVSRERGEVGTWRHADAKASGVWWDYVVGALQQAESLGAARGDYEVAVASDIPIGAGLSSSAALEVATVLAALALAGVSITDDGAKERVAMCAHLAETGFVGVSSGIMDQFASALCRAGHALHLQCDTATVRHVPFNRGILIVDTTAPRALVKSAYNTRRAECDAAVRMLRRLEPALPSLAAATPELLERADLPDPEAKRARHVSGEARRVEAFVQACASPDARAHAGALLNESHRSLRDDFECSTPELDWVVNHSVARVGIDGARLTGAGWGGCAIVMGDADALSEFSEELTSTFELAWDRSPRTWLTSAHDGARVD